LKPLTYKTSQFAERASVTVRTLRYYDKVGLLKPSFRTDTGHRLYTEEDLFRLEQILALKFLGFSLQDIRACLAEGPQTLQGVLQMQKALIEKKQHHLSQVIDAIRQVETLPEPAFHDWNPIISVIKVIQMKPQQKDWWKKYYTEEQVKILEKRQQTYTEEDALRDAGRWFTVIEAFKRFRAEQKDPASPKVQEAAKQWTELIQEFTQGDEGMLASMKKAHEAEDNPYRHPYSEEERKYIEEAVRIYRNKG
jgi:MerR family transcriptional regulator, thiopeptide resistance regulator